MIIKGVLFDFIGTTVIEKDPLALHRCFKSAFADHAVVVTDEMIRAGRGKDKKVMIRETLSGMGASVDKTDAILHSLQDRLAGCLDNFEENTGASDLFKALRKERIKLGIGSGLPRETFEKILVHLGWHAHQFDYIGIAEEFKNGRPHPDMIFDMLDKCGLEAGELIKIGDTVADIQEGKNAGVLTVAILSGTQPARELIDQKPDLTIRFLTELKEFIHDVSTESNIL